MSTIQFPKVGGGTCEVILAGDKSEATPYMGIDADGNPAWVAAPAAKAIKKLFASWTGYNQVGLADPHKAYIDTITGRKYPLLGSNYLHASILTNTTNWGYHGYPDDYATTTITGVLYTGAVSDTLRINGLLVQEGDVVNLSFRRTLIKDESYVAKIIGFSDDAASNPVVLASLDMPANPTLLPVPIYKTTPNVTMQTIPIPAGIDRVHLMFDIGDLTVVGARIHNITAWIT